MIDNQLFDQLGRKIIITGHYGSGKTEFAVSLAMLLAGVQEGGFPVSLIDLDIVNPYFRSRERREMLESAGIAVYGSVFDEEITTELPALGASLRAPLEDDSCRVIIDVGGNDTGALVLNQFSKYFTDDDVIVLAIVNANRMDTSSVEGALEHINAIEAITGLTVSEIVNNTHMLRETTVVDIIKGYELCKEVCKKSGKHLLFNCYPEGLVDPESLAGLTGSLMPLGLYMRPAWLDK